MTIEEQFFTWELLLEDGKRWHTASYMTESELGGYIDRGVMLRVTVQADVGDRAWEDCGAWKVNASKVCAYCPSVGPAENLVAR